MARKSKNFGNLKDAAQKFSAEWEDASSEEADSQTFYNEFFMVFGLDRRKVGAVFEKKLKKLSGDTGSIDLFWPGVLLAEHKSKGKDLDEAMRQAMLYFAQIPEKDKPKHIMISDFESITVLDVLTNKIQRFYLTNLVDNLDVFKFMSHDIAKQIEKDATDISIEIPSRETTDKKDKGGPGTTLFIFGFMILLVVILGGSGFEPEIVYASIAFAILLIGLAIIKRWGLKT